MEPEILIDLSPEQRELFKIRCDSGFNKLLGEHITKIAPGLIEGEMKVTPDLLQPWGFLHGGATISLLESVASAGAEFMCNLEVEQPFGVDVHVHHWKSGREGDTIRGVATFKEKVPSKKAGYKLFWDVAAYDGKGDAISDGVVEVKVVPKDYLAKKLAAQDAQ
jgi:1,4-dihydroxy-2-naphthoyl-CoA hydrolase